MDLNKLEQAMQSYRDIDPAISAPAMLTFLVIARLRDARQTDIQHRLDTSAASAMRNTAYWEQKGYVLRELDPTDARAWLLSLTEQGRAFYEKLKGI